MAFIMRIHHPCMPYGTSLMYVNQSFAKMHTERKTHFMLLNTKLYAL